MFGAAMKTTSTAGSSITARQSAVAAGEAERARPRRRRAPGTVSPQTTSSGSNVALGEQRRDAQQRAAVGLARASRSRSRRRRCAGARGAGRAPARGRARSRVLIAPPARRRARAASSCSSASSSAPPDICLTSSSRADLALAPVAHQPAAVEDHEAVADRVGVVRVVGDEDDAEPAVARLRDVAQHDARLLDARAPTSARRGSAPWRRSRRRARSRPPGARRPTACRPAGRGRARRCPSCAARSRIVSCAKLDVDAPQRARRPSSAPSRGRSCARSTSAAPSRGPGRPSRCRAPSPRAGELKCVSSPSTSSSPSSWRCTPERILMNVDLPAPLSPRTHVTSPASDADADVLQRDDVAEVLRDVADLEQRRAVGAVARWRSSPRSLRALADVVVDEDRDQQDHAEEQEAPVGVPARELDPDERHADDRRAERRRRSPSRSRRSARSRRRPRR